MAPSRLNVSGNFESLWNVWYRKFNNYELATEKIEKSDEVKVAILLTVVGDEGTNVFNTLKVDDKCGVPGKVDYNSVIQLFIKHFSREKNIVYERCCFLMHNRKERSQLLIVMLQS